MGPILFDVLGTPAPKGSARAFMTRGPNPRAVLAPGGSKVNAAKLRSWDQAVRQAVNGVTRGATAPLFVGVPLEVEIVFRLARPAGHWGARGLKPSAPSWPCGKPDVDKLARSSIDSMTGSIFDDDSRVVSLRIQKVFADPGCEGASFQISVMPPF